MHWHTVRFDEKAGTLEIYRHASDVDGGDPLILIDTGVDRFGRSPEAAEKLAAWLGRIVLADNPAARKALGLG
jgi:hypothetical protein